MHQSFTIDIPREYTISNNRTSPVWLRRKVKDALTALTIENAGHVNSCGRATIFVGVTKRTHGKYDPTNLSDTAKPIVDALVKTNVLDEDNYDHVIGPWLYHKGVDKRLDPGVIRFTITLTDYTPITF